MKKLISLSAFIISIEHSTDEELINEFNIDRNISSLINIKYLLIYKYNNFLQTPITIEMFGVDFDQPSLFPNFSNVQCIGEIYSHTITNGIINPYWFNIITQTWETNLKTISDLVQYSLEYDETLINN